MCLHLNIQILYEIAVLRDANAVTLGHVIYLAKDVQYTVTTETVGCTFMVVT